MSRTVESFKLTILTWPARERTCREAGDMQSHATLHATFMRLKILLHQPQPRYFIPVFILRKEVKFKTLVYKIDNSKDVIRFMLIWNILIMSKKLSSFTYHQGEDFNEI